MLPENFYVQIEADYRCTLTDAKDRLDISKKKNNYTLASTLVKCLIFSRDILICFQMHKIRCTLTEAKRQT